MIADDLYPSKRVLSWSPDCSIFAIATTHGHIACFDLLASNLCVIESVSYAIMVFLIKFCFKSLYT